MYFFVNDYNDIGDLDILEAIYAARDEYNVGYGFDDHCINARNLIKKSLGHEDIDIHFIPGGTPANVLAITCGMRQQDSVLALRTGHIEGHEAGSIETTGIKIETIDSPTGKLTADLIENKLEDFGPEFTTIPKKVYISNTTELGEVYTKKELTAIYDCCKKHGMYLFIDGARLSHALVSEKCDYSLKDICDLCDIFYLGGTKNGLPLGEALVIVNDELKKDFINLQKQKGYILAKSFVMGIMFETKFKTETSYLDGAKIAYDHAKTLAAGLTDAGFNLAYPFESNQVFVKLDEDTLAKWKDLAKFEVTGKSDGKTIVRLVTTYRTTESDIKGFLSAI